MSRAPIVCAGAAAVDEKLRLDAPAVPGTSNPGRASTSHGGVARNVAQNLAGLDTPVALVSAVGPDPDGAHIRDRLTGLGVDVRHLAVEPGASTARYLAVLDPAGELVIGVSDMAVIERIRPDRLDGALALAGEDALLFADTNLTPGVLAHVLRLGRAGRPVAVDTVSTAKASRLPADLTGVRLLCCNRDEARAWRAGQGLPAGAPETDADLAAALHAAGAAAVVLGLGPDGVLVHDGAGSRTLPAVPAAVVDVTGAGDALVAGVLAGLAAGQPLDTAVPAGLELASRTVASPLSVVWSQP